MIPLASPSLFRRALRSFVAGIAGVFGLLASQSTASAALVTNWTLTTGSSTTGLNTSSPVFGTGAGGSGNGQQIYGTLPATYTLAKVDDSLTFSGSAVFNLSASAQADQFRFGLFDTNEQTGNTGWLGYFATNSGTGANPNGRLWERKADNTAAYFNNGAAAADERQFSAGSPAGSFPSGTYSFSMTITRTEAGLSVAWSIVGTSLTYSISGTYIDTTPLTYSFDRVGLMSGGGLNANQVSFSGLDATFVSSVPEPASWATLAAAGALAFACLRRRVRA